MSELFTTLPWLAMLTVFVGMAGLQWRVINALDQALARQPIVPIPPAKPAVPVPVPAPAPDVPRQQPAAPTVTVDQNLVSAVKKFEGFSAKAYPDYKQYSIGYGTKANSSTETITEEEAQKRLAAELQIAEQSVEKFAPNAPVGVKQALTSLTYNAGPIWEQQTLGDLIKAGSFTEAKAHFVQYNHAGGQVNDGLTKRRNAEVAWFDNPL